MKRVFVWIISWITLSASAEVITMDLATATDMNDHPITYNTSYGNGYYDGTDVWDSTYNDSESCQFIYTNGARFMLSHIPSMNAYNGMSWEGFTLSKVSQDTANVFGCVANGGLAGEGTPYAIGYFSEWVTESQGFSSNIIFFDQANKSSDILSKSTVQPFFKLKNASTITCSSTETASFKAF